MSNKSDEQLAAMREAIKTSSDAFYVQCRREIDQILEGIPLPEVIPRMRLKDVRELMLISWFRGHSAAREVKQ